MFATVDDWAARPGNVLPSEADALADLSDRLESADRKIRRLTRSARFHHDTLGNPVDSTVADVLRKAVLEQLAYSDATDPDGFGGGAEAVVVGPVSLGAIPATGAGSTSQYAPKAVERLIDAGLLSSRVGVR